MDKKTSVTQTSSVRQILVNHGVRPTSQRVEIARLLFAAQDHFSAEQVVRMVGRGSNYVSRATVYNTLNLFMESGLVRQLVVDTGKIFYDSNTTPHYHYYNSQTGELYDIDPSTIDLTGLQELPAGMEVEGIDIIIRLRSSTRH